MTDCLLRDQTFTRTLRSRELDFQRRFPEIAEKNTGRSSVVVFSRSTDKETDSLSLHFAARGMALQRINCDALPRSLEFDPREGRLSLDGRQHQPVLVWTRAWSTFAISSSAGSLATEYMREQWESFRKLVTGLVPTISSPRTPQMETRTGQAIYAASVGARVADRIVTMSPCATITSARHDLMHKSLGSHFIEDSPGTLHGLFPVVRHSDAQHTCEKTDAAPSLMERYVAHNSLLRVYVIGEQVVSFNVRERDNTSLFTDPSSVLVETCETPDDIYNISLKVAAGFDNPVIAIDYLNEPGGKRTFLEANVNGDWLPYEQLSGVELLSGQITSYAESFFT